MNKRASSLWRVFAIPAVLALLTATGLIGALLGDGFWDATAWLGLGVPTLLAVRALLPKKTTPGMRD